MSEAQRSALNALLFRMGDQSKDIVLALATNRPGDLDSVVADRIDEVLEFPLPGEKERFKLLKLYLDKYIAQAGSTTSGLVQNLFKGTQQQIEIKGLTDDIGEEAAAETDGFSGREIAKLMASVQAAVYGSENCVLDTTLFHEVVDIKLQSINREENWQLLRWLVRESVYTDQLRWYDLIIYLLLVEAGPWHFMGGMLSLFIII